MNSQLPSSNNRKPLIVTYPLLRKIFVPYCKGKKPLLDAINDIWNTAVPQPQMYKGQVLKMIFPQHIDEFVKLLVKENG
jgi:hypothetical protein